MTRYDFLEPTYLGNSVIIHNDRFGVYSTRKDKELIPPLYEELCILSENLFAVKKDGFWGVVNSNNEFVAYPKFKSIVDFDSEFIELRLTYDSFCLMSKKNIYYGTSALYSDCSSFRNGYCVVVKNGLYGIINKSLVEVVTAMYYNIVPSKDNLFLAKTKDNVILINSKNKTLKTFNYNSIEQVNDTHSYIFTPASSSSKIVLGLLDNNLNEVVPAKYDRITPCSNNRLIVKIDDNYGVINLEGQTIIDCIYSYISYNDDIFFCTILHNAGNYAFDSNGMLITNRFAQSIKRVGDGFAVKGHGKYGIMDSNYKLVSNIIYDSVESICEHTRIDKKTARVTYRGKKGYFHW